MEWFGALKEGMGKSHSLGSGSSNRLLSTFPWVLPSSVSAVDTVPGSGAVWEEDCSRYLPDSSPRVCKVPFQHGFGPGHAQDPCAATTHKKCLAEIPVSPRGAAGCQGRTPRKRHGHLSSAFPG